MKTLSLALCLSVSAVLFGAPAAQKGSEKLPPWERVTLERVIDGDTLVVLQPVACPKGSKKKECALIRTCRLARINAPELRTPEGRAAKAVVEEVFLKDVLGRPRPLRARFLGREKYGRDLCEIETRVRVAQANGEPGAEIWVNLSDWLLARALAKPYPEAERPAVSGVEP